MRIHLGNGSVYLKEFINVDLWESGACLAAREPQRVQKWATTEDDYYSASRFRGEALDSSEFVCDAFGSWESLPFEYESADEILSRQCFEHLSKREAHWGLMEAWRVLKMGGVLRIDVPDHEEALFHYAKSIATQQEKDADFMLRHLLGSRKNDFAYHMGSWTKDKLIEFCAKRGFALVSEEKNIHFYPAFCLRFVKVPQLDSQSEFVLKLWDAAWQYAGDPLGTPLQVPVEWKCLEVGPGGPKRAWPQAHSYVDQDPHQLEGLDRLKCHIAEVTAMPFADKTFDFVLCSHILEHCDDLERACAELARVAKCGMIICPGIGKESMFNHHEADHKWWVHGGEKMLHFFPVDQRKVTAIANQDVQGSMLRLLRLGAPQFGPTGAAMRAWWRKAEPYFDSIQYWIGEPRITVHR